MLAFFFLLLVGASTTASSEGAHDKEPRTTVNFFKEQQGDQQYDIAIRERKLSEMTFSRVIDNHAAPRKRLRKVEFFDFVGADHGGARPSIGNKVGASFDDHSQNSRRRASTTSTSDANGIAPLLQVMNADKQAQLPPVPTRR